MQELTAALEEESLKYETCFNLITATGMWMDEWISELLERSGSMEWVHDAAPFTRLVGLRL